MRASGMFGNIAYDYPLDNRFALTFGAGIGWASVSPRLSVTPVYVNPLIVGVGRIGSRRSGSRTFKSLSQQDEACP